MLRKYGNFPGLTESWGRFKSTPTTSTRCVSRLYLTSGIAPCFYGAYTVSGGVEATNDLLFLPLRLFGSGEDCVRSSGDALVVGNGLDEKIIRLAFGRVPLLAADFEKREVFGVIDDGIELFATDLDLLGVACGHGCFTKNVERDGEA